MCLQLSVSGQRCQQISKQSKGCPLRSAGIIHGPSPSRKRIIVSLNSLFLLALCECESVRVCAGGRGMACIGVIISGQWKSSMRTSRPHKAISLSTPAVRGVCVYVCVCVRSWVCVCVCLPASVGCDFYIAIRRDSTDH